MKNPFYTSSYKLPKYFCNRDKEIEQLRLSLFNGRNTVLLSLRRMGKTGLIKHLFHQLEPNKDIHTFYFDIMNTHTIEEFVNKLADTVLGTFSTKSKRLYDNVFKFFTHLNPILSFDAQTGAPSIELKPHSEEHAKTSIVKIFDYLEKQDKRIYIAIDEFQQITNYENKSFEAFLRSHIQHLNNVSFIFSGSQQHILISMFASYSRPFYQSSDFLKLERIPKDIYASFIVQKFKETKKNILIEDVLQLLDWLDTYTYYIQNFFNKLWYMSGKDIDSNTIEKTKQDILDEHDYIYANMHNLLTPVQFKLMQSIAKQKVVSQPTSKEFINKYNLGTTSTISSAIKVLVDKELVYKENNEYKVYDVYLSKWLEKN